MTMQTLVINTDQFPIKTKHVAFYTSVDEARENISLREVLECFYPHPEAPEEVLISRLETKHIISFSLRDERSAALALLDHAQNNIKTLVMVSTLSCEKS